MSLAAATQCDSVGRAFVPALARVSSAAKSGKTVISHEPFGLGKPKTASMPFFVSTDSPHFPSSLRSIPRPPAGLWVRGSLPSPERRMVAVVGSRASSSAGANCARSWSALLVNQGFAVVSGGALGIDAAAHEGALSASGPTYAVLGCGADVVYPDRHSALFRSIESAGAVLSEYPPGTPPRSGQFPVRNRLIVGLAEAVLVVEARVRSGALVTARLAQKQGRRLLAVAGTPGTDALLRSGVAWPVANEGELMAALSGQRATQAGLAPLPDSAASIVSAIRAGMHTPAGISLYLGLPLSDVMAALVEAEMDGFIGRGAGSHYEVIYGH